ncbi:MAG: hypothetical protein ABI559_08610 [Chloroflexota bacterium]
MGMTTRFALHVVFWASLLVALLEFVPWFQMGAHVSNLTADGEQSGTALANAVLFASIATVCAVLALRMLRDPSELVWGALVFAAAIPFVLAGAALSETAACMNTSTYLNLVNTGFGVGCRTASHNALTINDLLLWSTVVLSAIVTLIALGLPIIESISRASAAEDDEVWA